MKPLFGILVCLLGLSLEARANQGLELTLSKPYSEEPGRFIVGLSWFSPRMSVLPGYEEYGMIILPPGGGMLRPDLVERPQTDFVGVYTGHLFVPASALVRPGFDFGWVWKRFQDQSSGNYSREFSFYYGVKVQVACLTFLVSSEGIGGGFNFRL